jgi:NADH-quinone oxidoreductase subunit M
MVDAANSATMPLISLMLLTPPLGALLLWSLPNPRQTRWIALATAVLTLLLALSLVIRFDASTADFQFVERQTWIATLNVHYLVGLDGLSVLFPALTALLFIGVMLHSWNSARHLPRLFQSLLLLLCGAIIGIYCALDLVLFFLFWEISLVPLYFLISLWGVGPNRRYAAVKYTLLMLAGGIPLLFGFLLLAFGYAEVSGLGIPAGLSWDYRQLLAFAPPSGSETLIFLLLLVGFACKTPLFPLHTWLPLLCMEGPLSVAALMTGLKLGAYGLLRFTLPLAPQAAQQYHWLLAGLGVIGIIYGALAALAQTNIRRLLAFSSISHVGLVVLGLASLDLQGVQGAVYQLFNFVLVAGGLFLLTGFLHHRTGSSDVIALGGVARHMPRLAALYLLFGLAAIGLPGTSGFPAEFLLLMSALKHHTGAGLAALAGMVLGAGYFLDMYRRAFLGPARHQAIRQANDMGARELLVGGALALLLLAAGLYPQALLDLTGAAAQEWAQRFRPTTP